MARTIDEARHILTVSNKRKLLISGSTEEGTPVIVLRRNEYGHYLPCVAAVRRAAKDRVTVDLWEDRSERVTVSRKAVLWEPRA